MVQLPRPLLFRYRNQRRFLIGRHGGRTRPFWSRKAPALEHAGAFSLNADGLAQFQGCEPFVSTSLRSASYGRLREIY